MQSVQQGGSRLVPAAHRPPAAQVVQSQPLHGVQPTAPHVLPGHMQTQTHGPQGRVRRPMKAAPQHVAAQQGDNIFPGGHGRLVQPFAVQRPIHAGQQPTGGQGLHIIAQIGGRGVPDHAVSHCNTPLTACHIFRYIPQGRGSHPAFSENAPRPHSGNATPRR